MKYYKDVNNNVFAYEADGSQDEYIKPNLVKMTQAEVDAHFAPSIDDIVNEKKVEIDVAHKAAIDAGVTYKAATFQSDSDSVQSLVKVLTALNNGWTLPTGFVWIGSTNVEHAANKTWLNGLNKAFADHEAALFARKQAAKKALAAVDVTASTAVADVQAVAF